MTARFLIDVQLIKVFHKKFAQRLKNPGYAIGLLHVHQRKSR